MISTPVTAFVVKDSSVDVVTSVARDILATRIVSVVAATNTDR